MMIYLVFWFLLVLSLMLCIVLYYIMSSGKVLVYMMFMDYSWSSIKMGMLVDDVSVLFSLVVVLVSASVMLFGVYYMGDEVMMNYFVMLVAFFVGGMLVLVLSGSFIVSYVGWDILGVVSFLLIMYYGNYVSVGGSMITMFMNRVGDCLLIVMFLWVLLLDQEWLVGGHIEKLSLCWISMLMVLAVMTKSAQFPYSAWLPLAMAAPTPVSALVHSSTLVTAGVYLMIRWQGVLDENSMYVLYLASVITIIYSGVFLISEEDVKKVVALSTLMHLGIMMSMIAMGMWYWAYVHMMLHAIYKSLLFVSVGVVLVNMAHEQSFGGMSSVCKFMSYNSSMMFISVLSLSGLPYFSGFYSKEVMVGLMMVSSMSVFWMVMGLLGLSVSFLYSLRLLSMFVGSAPSHGTVVMGLKLIGSVKLWLMVFGGLSMVIGWVVVQALSSGLMVVESLVSEMLFMYLFMGLVVVGVWGVKVVFLVSNGFWADLFTEVWLFWSMKIFTVVVKMDMLWSDYLMELVGMVGVESSSAIVWSSLYKSLLVYAISFMFLMGLLL
uniref:NADH:ubiquinone reductase (H(+)-translocating) n=1 Tax=Macracanthorhynchus hirudinaceus TaxID=1032456 RepID=K0JA14_MACHR|nr:NADH dehydrogenase subunit 5 [Macracanthorhynchus hirudinaceus]CCA94498.2 NADH Dehydrogenase subunit 5 [Macracanthorhynchus hirudinaceus]